MLLMTVVVALLKSGKLCMSSWGIVCHSSTESANRVRREVSLLV